MNNHDKHWQRLQERKKQQAREIEDAEELMKVLNDLMPKVKKALTEAGKKIKELIPKQCDEMLAIRKMLDEKGIPWIDASDKKELCGKYTIERTKAFLKGWEISIVHGFGTYGGWTMDIEDQRLLELRIGQATEPEGWLTADQVMEKINTFFSKL